jgi:catechol 2,3-dioxygenase-like lactoylglutathione lyase family enzyme
MIRVKQIDHYGIIIPNLEAAIQWYEEMLNFNRITVQTEILAAPDWKIAFLKCGSSKLELLEQRSLSAIDNGPTAALSRSSFIGKKHIAFAVDDLEETYRVLDAKGVAVLRPITQYPELPVRFCHFSDPWGNTLEFVDAATVAMI